MDRLYTSFEVADWLLERKITMVGTIQSNRVGIPSAVKAVDERELNSYDLYWRNDGKCNLSSYVVKTSKGKKNVLLLSTVEPLLGVTKDDKQKPALYKLYDFTKGGTDIIDQKMGAYTTKSKSRKWTKVAFSYLLDTIRVNASTIYALANKHPKEIKSFHFGTELADSLIMPFLTTRSLRGLSKSVCNKITLYMGKQEENVVENRFNFPAVDDSAKRCRYCLDNIAGDGYKAKKVKLSKKKTLCRTCGKTICEVHMVAFCEPCYK